MNDRFKEKETECGGASYYWLCTDVRRETNNKTLMTLLRICNLWSFHNQDALRPPIQLHSYMLKALWLC